MRAFYDRFRSLLIILGAALVGIGIGGAIIVLGRHAASPRTGVEADATPVARQAALGETRAAFATATYESILNRVSDEVVATYYASNHNILVLDFPSLWHQARALNRVAALIEKRGAPRDRILSDDELLSYAAASGKHYETIYFGHNYTSSGMARFYNLAQAQELSLNPSEERLHRLLLDSGFVSLESGRYVSGLPAKVLISIVRASTGEQQGPGENHVDRALRETVFVHELSHGEFHTNAHYRDYCIRFWRETMSEEERAAFRQFLAGNDYDLTDQELVVNEAQAYLAHTPDPRAFNAAMVGLSEQALERLHERFWSGLELHTDLKSISRPGAR